MRAFGPDLFANGLDWQRSHSTTGEL
jgi:hypothetical protein